MTDPDIAALAKGLSKAAESLRQISLCVASYDYQGRVEGDPVEGHEDAFAALADALILVRDYLKENGDG